MPCGSAVSIMFWVDRQHGMSAECRVCSDYRESSGGNKGTLGDMLHKLMTTSNLLPRVNAGNGCSVLLRHPHLIPNVQKNSS